jgi:hypothetical protein
MVLNEERKMTHNYKKSAEGIYPIRLAVETAIDRFREAQLPP